MVEEKPNRAIEEFPPPSQQILYKEKLFQTLEDWKNSLEEGELARHTQHYFGLSNPERNADHQNLMEQKKKMFNRYEGIRLDIGRSNLVVNGGKVWVSFNQRFSSNSMDSLGRKDLQMVRDGREWKIRYERFKLKDFHEKDGPSVVSAGIKPMGADNEDIASPYVVHVTSHVTHEEARKTVDKLRKAGYDAYLTELKVTKSKRIYRVYVGRYSNWDLASESAMELRNLKFCENSIPSPHPWTIQVGNFLSSDDAEEKLDSLRILGLSPFLFTISESAFSFPAFRVYLGAFIKENQARQMMADLELLEIPHTLVTP